MSVFVVGIGLIEAREAWSAHNDKGVYFHLADARSKAHLDDLCELNDRLFHCMHVFETGVFGTSTAQVHDKDIRDAFGPGAQGPGEEIMQDLTEGTIHPHSVTDTPQGLSSIVNLAGREIGDGTSDRRRLAEVSTSAMEQLSKVEHFKTYRVRDFLLTAGVYTSSHE